MRHDRRKDSADGHGTGCEQARRQVRTPSADDNGGLDRPQGGSLGPEDGVRERTGGSGGGTSGPGRLPVPWLRPGTEDIKTILSIHPPPGTKLDGFPTGSGREGTLAETRTGDRVYYTKTEENGRTLHGPHTVVDIRLLELPRMSRPYLNLPDFYLDKEDFMIPVNPRRIVRADKLKRNNGKNNN